MPVLSHLVSGTVYDIYGVALASATITITHATITPVLSAITGSDGKYIINLSGLSSQWSVGNSITATASKTGEGTKTTTTTIISGGGQTINLTLEETSDLNYYPENVFNQHNLNFALLTHYDGRKVTRERPLPVSSSEIDLLYNPSWSWAITRGDGQPDSESVVIRGVTYTRTFTYNANGQMITRSEWVRQ